jgi:acyl-CoA synthetase (AMP-forming)/AMP-acid ligase II
VAAVVVPVAGQHVAAEDLIAFSHARLASYKKPELVVFTDVLPRTAMGKLLRRDLRAALASGWTGTDSRRTQE